MLRVLRTTLVCERRAESGDLKSGEHIENKNSKIVRLKLGVSKKIQEYTRNILESANNSKKIGPISVGCIGH